MIKDKIKAILQDYINNEYGIEKSKEITLATVMATLDNLLL